MVGAIAEYEKKVIVLKLRGARQRMKARTGRCEGAKPYGTREGEAATLKLIQQLRASGMAYDKIAAHLDAKGLKPRRGAKWHPFAVQRILARAGQE